MVEIVEEKELVFLEVLVVALLVIVGVAVVVVVVEARATDDDFQNSAVRAEQCWKDMFLLTKSEEVTWFLCLPSHLMTHR